MSETDYATQVWEWLGPPLQALKEIYRAEPEKGWEERRQEFLGWLGLHDPSDHPAVAALIDHLDRQPDEPSRVDFLVSGQADSFVYEWAQQAVDAYADQDQSGYGEHGYGEQGHGEQPDQSPAHSEVPPAEMSEAEVAEVRAVVEELMERVVQQVPAAADLSGEERIGLLLEVLDEDTA
jgi:hypothetical protein